MKAGTVLGIGGVFFKAEDPEGLCKWYETCLGMKIESDFTGGTFPTSQMPEETEFGDFGWVIDPEGHKVELWKPK
jgi:hypothetical protein